jgi:hypothetical protein
VDDSWQRITITPEGPAEIPDVSMIVTLTNAWSSSRRTIGWFAWRPRPSRQGRKRTNTRTGSTKTVVVDGLPQGDVKCFSITTGELVVEPGQRDIAQVGFELDSDPTGNQCCSTCGAGRSIQVSRAV